MTRRLVESSQLAAVGYDPDAAILEIEFKPKKNGDRVVWQYFDVPLSVVTDFISAPSLGRAFGSLIKPTYAAQMLSTIRADGTEVPF